MAAIVEEGNCGTGATCSPRPGLFFDCKKSYICAFVFCVFDVRLFILVRRPAVVCVLSLCVGL